MESLFLHSKGRTGREDSASAGKYLWRLCIDPMNNFNCDRVRGSFSNSISSIFRAKGVIPLGVFYGLTIHIRLVQIYTSFLRHVLFIKFFQNFFHSCYVVNFGYLGYYLNVVYESMRLRNFGQDAIHCALKLGRHRG